jgi:FkbM family methyltransferase
MISEFVKIIKVGMLFGGKLFVKIQRRRYLLHVSHWRNLIHIRIIHLYLREPKIQIRVIGDGYGAWAIPEQMFTKDDVVMLVGVGEDVSLDTYFAKLGCRTILCDPTPRAISHAKTKLSSYLNVEIIEKGIWTKSGTTKFFFPKDPKHISLSIVNLQKTEEFLELDIITIDELLHQLGVEQLSILKLDIEGAAYLVLLDIFRKKIYPKCILVDIESSISTIELLTLLTVFRKLGYSLSWARNRDCLFIRNNLVAKV